MIVRVTTLGKAIDAGDEVVAAERLRIEEVVDLEQDVVVVAALGVADVAERRRVKARVVVGAVEEHGPGDEIGRLCAGAVGELARRVVAFHEQIRRNHAVVMDGQKRLRIDPLGEAGLIVDIVGEARVGSVRVDAEP